MSRVLFVLRWRESPYENGQYSWGDGQGKFLSSGLYNSARLVSEMLDHSGIPSKIVHVQDNSFIHREAVAFKATHVVIEAYWVVPSKFQELLKALPGVQFIIRNHSEIPFLASEGMSMDWSLDYTIYPNVILSCNSLRANREMRFLVGLEGLFPDRVVYLPNYYPMHLERHPRKTPDEFLDVGCFGAIRPLKNQLLQAVASLKVADNLGKKLRFHVNAGRVEMAGQPVLKNLRQMFAHYAPKHILVEQKWRDHEEFRELVAQMDIVSQVSFSETFNIVSADAVTQHVPAITSKEVPWANERFMADPVDSLSMEFVMGRALQHDWAASNLSLRGLEEYNRNSKEIWLSYLGV